jgi:hypothetical protein
MQAGESPASPTSAPLPIDFVVRATNYYGSPAFAIGYQFRVQADDRYIARLEIVPGKVEIASGWSVNLRVSIQEPRECGDLDTPIAVLPAQFFLVAETKLKALRETKLHTVFQQSVLLV